MARLRYNLVSTTLGGNLTNVATAVTFTSALTEGGVNIPTIVSPDIVVLNIGDEIVHLTTYSAGAFSGTILRGQGDIPAVSHLAGVSVRHVSTKDDFAAAAAAAAYDWSVLRIASTSASAGVKAAADYVCDGTNDQVEINAAITALPAAGGVIELSEGVFGIGARIIVGKKVIFRGLGKDVTSISINYSAAAGAANSVIGCSYHTTFEDLKIYTNTAPAADNVIISAAAGLCVIRSTVDEGSYTGTAIYCSTAVYQEIYIYNSYISAYLCLDIQRQGLSVVKDSTIRCYGYIGILVHDEVSGGYVANIGSLLHIQGNRFYGAYSAVVARVDYGTDYMGQATISNNVFTETRVGVTLGIADGFIISNNEFIRNTEAAIEVYQGSNFNVITNNRIQAPGTNGIRIEDSDDNLIEGNLINGASRVTDNTNSGIFIDGNSNRNSVINNTLRRASGNQPLYGIRIDDSTCDDNLVQGNDLYTSSKAAGKEVSDMGTGTRGHEVLVIAVGDETTEITTGVGKTTFRMPFAMCLTRVRASLNTASSSGIPTFDIKDGVTTIMTTNKLSIDASETTSVTAATAAVITDSAIADDAIITVDIVGAGTGAKGPKVSMYGWRV